MTEGQQATCVRASKLLTAALNASWWGPPSAPPHPYDPRWPGRNDVGIRIPGLADRLTPAVIDWFRSQGWLAAGFRDDLFIAPLVEVEPPEFCFHVTPAANVERILQRGLMRGADAGRSTTERPDAAQRIHVAFDRESAEEWTEKNMLGKHNPGGAWVLFQIDRRGIGSNFLSPSLLRR
jgi:hypothetical protein